MSNSLPVTEGTWRELYPFDSHFLDLGGIRYHYLDEGQGDPVVMVHGNPTWSFYYRNLAVELRSTHRVVVPDHVGCGLSDKPQHYRYRLANHIANLERLLVDELDLHNMTLVVHDWGGAIGMGVAVKHPERIARMVVMNTAAFLLTKCPLRILICKVPFFGPFAIRACNAFAGGALWMASAHRDRLTRQVKSGYLAPYNNFANRIATLRFVQDIPLRPSHPTWSTIADVEKRLSTLDQKPMAIIWGERDFCFTTEFRDMWMRYFPRAQLHSFRDAGHYVLEDAYERIASVVQELLKKKG